jgi:hypothetical protein
MTDFKSDDQVACARWGKGHRALRDGCDMLNVRENLVAGSADAQDYGYVPRDHDFEEVEAYVGRMQVPVLITEENVVAQEAQRRYVFSPNIPTGDIAYRVFTRNLKTGTFEFSAPASLEYSCIPKESPTFSQLESALNAESGVEENAQLLKDLFSKYTGVKWFYLQSKK